MSGPKPKVAVQLVGEDAERVQRVAAMFPGLTPNSIGRRAVAAGIDSIERELREAALALVGNAGLDSEGL
ncbi:MAG TPA: hypothetical protein VGM90_14945 [Kofleriaceae bacterium]|jgi:hypothetical protein